MALSNQDAKFLQDMIKHHQAALDMSNAYLKVPADRRDKRVTALAENIVKAQTKEIGDMSSWLQADGRGISPPAGSGMKM